MFINFLAFDFDFRVHDAVKSQKSLQDDLQVWIQKEKEAQDKIEDDSKRNEKWAAKENVLHQKIDECTEKISALGALPQVDPVYTKMSLKTVSDYISREQSMLLMKLFCF